jgi:hypothetical protein
MREPDWSADELDTLERGWTSGKTAGQLSLELEGRSRNAVIGMARRRGLKQPPREKPTGSAYERRKRGDVVGGIRKAYASRGDDCTLSRFVKVPGQHKQLRRRQWTLPGLEKAAGGAIAAGRSLFHAKGVKPVDELPHVLVSGHNNVKIGRDVRKGTLRGYWIYTLSLEERATCPRTCHHWRNCYGNNMPYARRVDHRDPVALMAAIEANVARLLRNPRRVGILVRLHALGDFFSAPYVWFWAKLLDREPRLAVFGYTAYPPDSEIGRAVAEVKARHGRRFAIRWSNGGAERDCTVSLKSHDVPVPAGTFACPEQTGKTAACATCALCWATDRNVAFVEH